MFLDILVLGAFVSFITFLFLGYHKSKYDERVKSGEFDSKD